jgi:phosphoribosylamine--glycine ligase
VVEEFMEGEEASFFAMCDGDSVIPLVGAQDHKRVFDGDKGPNTGGMGAYSPAPVLPPATEQMVMERFIRPTVAALNAKGIRYMGVMYLGLMFTKDGPKLVEYNCRFGDPETQPIMMRLRSDLVELCEAALDKRLDAVHAEWDPRAALGVVLAAGGYPDTVRKGDVIAGLDAAARLPGKVFHAGTQLADGRVVTNGGRVLCAVGLGDSVSKAQAHAYALVDVIHWTGMQCRRDIGYRAIAREQ